MDRAHHPLPGLPGLLAGLIAILAGLLLSACAATKSVPDDGGAAGSSLDGTTWVLATLPVHGPLVGERPTARFEAGQVGGTDGCNRYSAPFTVSGSTLAVGPGGTMTLMACELAVMAQAEAFRGALERARRFRIVDGRLELLASDGAIVATMTSQSSSLVGAWEVFAVNNGRQAVVGVLEEAPLDMTFAKDGTVAGSAGCNRFTATFEADGSAVRFGPAATTRRTCPGEGVMEQEQAFLNALASVATMRIEGDRLEFRTADDALALMLRRAAAR